MKSWEAIKVVNDEQLELDEVAGDFCDWFSERIHILCVRQSKKHYEFHKMYNALMKGSFDNDCGATVRSQTVVLWKVTNATPVL